MKFVEITGVLVAVVVLVVSLFGALYYGSQVLYRCIVAITNTARSLRRRK